MKVPTRPAALKVQVGWKMIEMFNKSTDVDFEFQKTMVDKLLSSHAGNFVNRTLEKKMFERSVEIVNDTRYGGYVLDDELISSKASDIEHKVASDRKSGGEGPTCDCFCDSYVQLMLGMRVRLSGDMQLFNMEKLLDTLPTVVPNAAFAFGPILACDHGYGKKTTVEMFAKCNFKVVVIANSIGSEYPIVGTSAVKDYIQKICQN